MNLGEILKPLENLYTITKMDWNFTVHHTITEPTCPNISIRPEDTNISRYMAACDPNDIEETLIKLVEKVRSEIIDGNIEPATNWPMTNSDDSILAEWLEKRRTDKDVVFPYKVFYDNFEARDRKANPEFYAPIESEDLDALFGTNENKDQNNA